MKACTFKELGKYGRLGNQLFQVASTIGIAKKNNANYYFPDWEYQPLFKNKLPHLNEDVSAENLYVSDFHFIDIRISDNRYYNLSGYLQSEKYWGPHKQEILHYFEFSNDLKKKVNKKYEDLFFEQMVCVHVRRDDFLKYPDHHPVLPIEYYLKAMQQFTDCVFMIFSDDMEWCRKNFKNVEFISGNSAVEDLYLMTQCEAHIIANSSFSWWGQYLAQSKNVIAPAKNKWFGSALKHNVNDLYQDHWKLIDF